MNVAALFFDRKPVSSTNQDFMEVTRFFCVCVRGLGLREKKNPKEVAYTQFSLLLLIVGMMLQEHVIASWKRVFFFENERLFTYKSAV